MTRLINLTPHAITFMDEAGATVAEVPPSGEVARVATTSTPLSPLELPCGSVVPVSETAYGEVESLPPPAEGTAYVVSSIVLAAVPERRDVFAPGELVRDEAGRVIGTRGLRR